MIRSNLGRKGFISAYSPSRRKVRAGAEIRNPEAGTEADAVEGFCFLVCSSWLFSLLSYRIQNCLPRGGTTHNGLGLPTSIINQSIINQSSINQSTSLNKTTNNTTGMRTDSSSPYCLSLTRHQRLRDPQVNRKSNSRCTEQHRSVAASP